jgi:hypothetical protein
MLYKTGRFLQLIGLILLPVGMAGNLARPEEFGTTSVFVLLLVGAGIFTLGYLIQQMARRS